MKNRGNPGDPSHTPVQTHTPCHIWACSLQPMSVTHKAGTPYRIDGQTNSRASSHSPIRILLALLQQSRVAHSHRDLICPYDTNTHNECHVSRDLTRNTQWPLPPPRHCMETGPRCHGRNGAAQPEHLTFLLPVCLITCYCPLGK